MRILVIYVVAGALLLVSPFIARGDEPVPGAYAPGELLIKYKPSRSLAASGHHRERHGFERLNQFDDIGLHHVILPGDTSVKRALEICQTDPDVEYAEPNYYRYATVFPNDPGFDQQWALENVGQNVVGTQGVSGADISAGDAWDITTGGGVLVAVIDSGITFNHPDLRANIWRNPGEVPANGIDDEGNGFVDDIVGWDFFFNDNNPIDIEGHGTHVAGILGARGNNGIGVAGVNWAPRIMVLRFTGFLGQGTLADEISAIRYAAAMGARVINMSFSGPDSSRAEKEAIEALQAVVVCAAGNDGTNNDAIPQYPANYTSPNIITVASTDQNDRLAAFSNFGPVSVDVAAPGEKIFSTWPGGYNYKSGTSFAAPMVSGLASLILTINPSLSPNRVISIIKRHVDRLPALAGFVATGGRINAARALRAVAPGGGDVNAGDGGDGGSKSSCFVQSAGS